MGRAWSGGENERGTPKGKKVQQTGSKRKLAPVITAPAASSLPLPTLPISPSQTLLWPLRADGPTRQGEDP